MKPHLNSYSDTMFLTIQWARQDRVAMLDCVNTEAEKESVRKEIRAIDRLRRRLFGNVETKEEHYFRTAKSVSVKDLFELARGDEFDGGDPDNLRESGSK